MTCKFNTQRCWHSFLETLFSFGVFDSVYTHVFLLQLPLFCLNHLTFSFLLPLNSNNICEALYTLPIIFIYIILFVFVKKGFHHCILYKCGNDDTSMRFVQDYTQSQVNPVLHLFSCYFCSSVLLPYRDVLNLICNVDDTDIFQVPQFVLPVRQFGKMSLGMKVIRSQIALPIGIGNFS